MSGSVAITAGLLGRPAFRWLALASTVNRLGGSIAPIALAFAVLDLTGSVTALGIVVGSRSVANVLFLLLGGVLADRLPRNVVLVGSSFAAAITQAAVAVLIFAKVDSVTLLAALSAVNGIVAAFSMPAGQALIPQTVPAEQLMPANALIRMGANAANVLGASIAGILVASIGSAWGIAIDAITFALAAVGFALIRLPAGGGRAAVPSSVWRDLADGWNDFVARTWLWLIVVAFTAINGAWVAGVAVLGPVVADETFGRREWGFGVAMQMVGFLVGGLLALRWRPRRLLLWAMLCCLPMALPLAALGLHAAIGVVLVAQFLCGVGVEQFGVAWQTSMHRFVPDEMQARVSSYDMVGSLIAVPIAEIAVGPISHILGISATLYLAAGVIVLAVTATLISGSVRDLTLPDD